MTARADLAVFDAESAPVLRWLRGLDDLLGAVAVAGLGWPDPDLPDDLAALATEARGLGAASGADRLEALGRACAVVRATEVGAERRQAAHAAFVALMEAVGWARLFRSEIDLLAVQGALAARGDSEPVARGPSGATSSAVAAIVGAELAGERLVLHGIDADGTRVVLLDTLVEVDDADPVGRPAISRLFQARIRLADVLGSRVQLDAHPVQVRSGVRLFRPAFDRAPRLVAASGSAPLPRAGTDDRGRPELPRSGDVVAAPLRIGRDGARAVVTTASGVPLEVPETAVLRFTLSKLAIREGSADVLGVLRGRNDVPSLVGVTHPHDGTCFPAIDPRAFPLSASRLAERAADDRSVGALWLRAVLARVAGEADPGLVQAIAEAVPADAAEAARIGRAARAIGRPVPPSALAVAPGVLTAATATGLDRIRALWLLLSDDALDLHQDAIRACWDRWYATPPADPDPGDVCARAMLIDLLEIGADQGSPAERAVAWLDAHLSAMRLAARAREPRLPSLEALAWLAETRVILTGDGAEAPLAALDLPPERLRLGAIDALWRGVVLREDPGAAGDAVWAMGLAGLGAQLFG